MKKIVKRDYALDEGIIVIHHTLDALYQKYCCCIPDEVDDLILNLLNITEELLNFPKDDEIRKMDIKNEDYVRRVEYTEM